MIIVGAGMAGLLAGALLRNECSAILEAQPELPNNHSAVLRFRSSIVGDALNIPFKKVSVLKYVQPWNNPIGDALSYSYKSNGSYRLRSVVNTKGEMEERYIAPPDLIQRMADRVMAPIKFGSQFILDDAWSGKEAISTMPMPVLMKLLMWPDIPEFRSVTGFNIVAQLTDSNVDAYASMYVPDPSYIFSRVSLTGNQLILECPKPFSSPEDIEAQVKALELHRYVEEALELFSLNNVLYTAEVKIQKYAKIIPIDETVRKQFMYWATDQFGIYSLGRFATWRPGLMLDDLVNDIRVIDKIRTNGAYHYRRS